MRKTIAEPGRLVCGEDFGGTVFISTSPYSKYVGRFWILRDWRMGRKCEDVLIFDLGGNFVLGRTNLKGEVVRGKQVPPFAKAYVFAV